MITTTAAPARWQSPHLYNDTEGDYLCEFVESLLVNPTSSFGAEQFTPIELREWQRELFRALFELKPDGSYRHRTGLIGLPKKNAKSFLAAAIALYALLTFEANSLIVLCAAAKDQTKNVFDPARQMAEASPALAEVLKIERHNIRNTLTGSVLKVISADAGTQDGVKPNLVIFDEVHRQPREAELWDVMTKGIVTTPNAMVIGLTTAGYDQESLCYRLYDYGKKVSTGEIEDSTFFFRWWEPRDPDASYDDPDVWAECNPGLGDFVSLEDFEAEAKRSPENSFRRYNLNQWTKTASAWLKFGAWEDCKTDRRLVDGERVVLGFDGSSGQSGRDATGLVACSVDNGLHVEVLGLWQPQSINDVVPVWEVVDTIKAACRRFKVVEIAADPSLWREQLEQLANEGYPIVKISQNGSWLREYTALFENLVYEKRISNDGDARLASHIGNAVVTTHRQSGMHHIAKAYNSSLHKMDLAVASVMAVGRAATASKPKARPTITKL